MFQTVCVGSIIEAPSISTYKEEVHHILQEVIHGARMILCPKKRIQISLCPLLNTPC